MPKRDFSAESAFNILIRGLRFLTHRWRGLVIGTLSLSCSSGRHLTFGRSPRIINARQIRLGNKVSFGDFCRLETYRPTLESAKCGEIIVGNDSHFGDLVHIGSINYINIGRSVLCGSKVLIVDHNHGDFRSNVILESSRPPRERTLSSKGPIEIGDNVWIGESACILAGSKIGSGAVIAAGAVVRGQVPPNTIYFGK